jgi:hypothetical protein
MHETYVSEIIIALFRSGELTLDHSNAVMVTDAVAVYAQAEQALAEMVEKYGDEAAEVMGEMHPNWPKARIDAIITSNSPASQREIEEHGHLLLDDDQHIEFTIMVGKFHLTLANTAVCWIVVREAGIALDREFEVCGFFNSEQEATEFINKAFV